MLRRAAGGHGRELAAVAHADQFFRVELPAAAQWSFDPADAQLINVPILNVTGSATVPRFVRSAELIQSWFPSSIRYELPGTGHLLMAQAPEVVAAQLVRFWT
jgi:pimeloyl-ACP methyl ester carboxylesterase